MKLNHHHFPGLLLVSALALTSLYAASLPWFNQLGLSALTLAILSGMVLGNTIYPRISARSHAGVTFAKGELLRLGIILFGFKLTFQDIAAVGVSGIVIDVCVLTSTFCLAFWLGRRKLGLDEQSVILIGAGSSICGAAAILATERVIKAQPEKVAVAVATVVVFGTLSMFLYPLLFSMVHALGLSDRVYGVFTGSTVHEVAQVVAAGRAVSEQAANSAVITKMIRVMMLAPFLVILSAWLTRRHQSDERSDGGLRTLTIPWFALGFLVVTGFNSLNWLLPSWSAQLIRLDDLLLAMAMGALGLTTHISAIHKAGSKPMVLATVLFAWLLLGGALINGGVVYVAQLF